MIATIFLLLLQSQAAYAFRAEHLDFRQECLGPVIPATMEEAWQEQDDSMQPKLQGQQPTLSF